MSYSLVLPCSATLEKKSEVATNHEVVSVIPDARGAAWYWWRRFRGRPRLDEDEDMAVNEAVDTSRMWGSILNDREDIQCCESSLPGSSNHNHALTPWTISSPPLTVHFIAA